MNERRLIIDDERTEEDLHKMGLASRVDVIARNYWEGLNQLETNGPWDVLYLDHDLGSFDENNKEFTGYTIMCELEEAIMIKEFPWIELPKKIICVSSNPSGRKRIEQVIKKLEEYR